MLDILVSRIAISALQKILFDGSCAARMPNQHESKPTNRGLLRGYPKRLRQVTQVVKRATPTIEPKPHINRHSVNSKMHRFKSAKRATISLTPRCRSELVQSRGTY